MQNTFPDSLETPQSKANSPRPQIHSASDKPSSPGWVAKLSYVVLIGFAFGAGWMSASSQRDQAHKDRLPPAESRDANSTAAVSVTAEPIGIRFVQRTVEALGTLHGFEEVTISARVEGRVSKVLHDISDSVKPAELLLEIDPTDYELSVQQSDRALQVELAKLGLKSPPDTKLIDKKLDLEKIPIVAKAKSLMDHAKSRNERVARLASTKNASAEDLENAASDYRTALAEYDNQIVQAESGLATIQMKQVELMVARERLANSKVFAPTPTIPLPGNEEVTYVISQRLVSEGTVVRPGMEIFRIVICQTLKFRVSVPERHSKEIQLDQPVDVVTATSATPFRGAVTKIYPVVDETTRTFQVEIQVPNPNGELKPGSFAKAVILTHVDPAAVTVPLSSLVQFAGVTKIFLAENNRATEVPVTLGIQTAEWVEIAQPRLSAGSLVITSGQTAIANDTAIVIRSTTNSSNEAASLLKNGDWLRRNLITSNSSSLHELPAPFFQHDLGENTSRGLRE